MALLRRPARWALVPALCAWASLHAQQDGWDQADREVRRLAPSAFVGLPAAVVADLERRSCSIPQVWSDTVPGNVISGRFRQGSETDWAVLCSVNRVSTILVYWEGRADSVAELAAAPDRNLLQGVGGGRIGYSRALGAVGAEVMRRKGRGTDGPPHPPLDHQGIEDAFVEKASVIWYWHAGTWLMLPGAD